jgi:hypothetical protein
MYFGGTKSSIFPSLTTKPPGASTVAQSVTLGSDPKLKIT